MSIITAFPGIKRSVVYPFCFLPFLGLFFMKLTITFSATLSLCRFGDHVLLFSGSKAMMLVFQASCFQISCDFFHPTYRPPQSQETYSTLNERKGDDLSLMVSFWASPPPCFCVFLYTCLLLCFVLFCRWSKLKLYKDPQYSLWRLSKAHKKNEKRDDLLTARAIGWG